MSTPERAACCGTVEALLAEVGGGRPAAPHPAFDARAFLRAAGGDPALYVVAPPSEPGRAAHLVCGLLGAVLDEAFAIAAASPRQALDRPLLVVLDGTAGAAPVRELGQYLAVASQLNITLLATFRDLPDVEQGYGTVADEVVGSAQEVAFLGTQTDERTLRLLGDLTGRWPEAAREPLVDSVRLFGRGQALLLSETLPPLPFWTRPWSDSASLVELVRARPYAHGVGWTEEVGPQRSGVR
jgi:hypothetical protein